MNKVLYNGATLHLVSSTKPRKPTILCWGELREIQRYFGLHCLPIRLRNAPVERWLYCFLVHERNNTVNTYVKIILEKQDDVLVVIVQYSTNIFMEIFLNACFCEQGSDLIDIRAVLMFNANTFTYDSIKRFRDDLREYECTSYRIVWCADHTSFLSV
jgi:hypothetical protein